MDRRTLLRRALVAGTVGLAGCSGGDTVTETPTEAGPATDPPTATPTEAPTATPTDTRTPTDAPTSTGEPTPTPTETPTRTATESPTPTPTAEPTPTPTPSTGTAQEVVVGPGGALQFEPESFTVTAGEAVRWVWDSGGHNVSPADGGQPRGADWPGKDDQFTYPAGTEHVHTFEVAGDYDYHCDPHQSVGMVGSFTVEEG